MIDEVAARPPASGQATPTAAEAPAVDLRAVTAGNDGQAALEGVDLEIARGSLLAIFGPNGGGKTTLLKLIAGVLRPWAGSV